MFIVVKNIGVGFVVDRVFSSRENQEAYMKNFAPRGAVAGVTNKKVYRGWIISANDFVADNTYVYATPQKTIKNYMCR